MKIVFAGTPANAAQTLRALANSAFEVVAVLTRTDAPVGRKKILTQSAVADAADELGLPVIKANRVDEATRLQLKATGADLGIIVAYGALLDQAALDILEKGWINLHYSLLPKWRGAAPVQRAIMAGDRETGVTLFQLDKGMDTGPIYSQRSIEIDPKWRSFELLQRLAQEGPSAVDEALSMISTGKSPNVQHGEASLAPKITKHDAMLKFSDNAKTLVNAIRAFTYEPGAWCTWNNEPFKITSATIAQDFPLKQGEIFVDGQRVVVGCAGTSSLTLLTVVPAGKKEMSAADWARGARLQGGETFG